MATRDSDTKPAPINLDAEPENADWAKRTWDLPDITSADDLRKYLDDVGMTVAAFKRLPVYRWNVDQPGMEWLREL